MVYPPIEPYRRGWLEVGDGHQLYWDESGNPSGVPAVVLHGGPGGSSTEMSRRWFDPRHYRIIAFDQRGCGRSTPHASTVSNTTGHLLADLEALRIVLGVDRWILMGRSWGAALAIAYAEQRPEHVGAMIVSAVFTARKRELDWLYRGGAAHLFPDAWSDFIAPIPKHDRARLIEAYHALLTSGDPTIERAAARSWCTWEDTISTFLPVPRVANDREERARALIGSHYFVHGAFLREGELLTNAHRLRTVPGVIVQGRYDLVTPPITAWELHQPWPGSRLQLVPDAGHASGDPAIMRSLIDATDALIPSAVAR